MSVKEKLKETFNKCFYMQWLFYISAKIIKMYHVWNVSESLYVLIEVENVPDSDSVCVIHKWCQVPREGEAIEMFVNMNDEGMRGVPNIV
jgi:hypothetical protein